MARPADPAWRPSRRLAGWLLGAGRRTRRPGDARPAQDYSRAVRSASVIVRSMPPRTVDAPRQICRDKPALICASECAGATRSHRAFLMDVLDVWEARDYWSAAARGGAT